MVNRYRALYNIGAGAKGYVKKEGSTIALSSIVGKAPIRTGHVTYRIWEPGPLSAVVGVGGDSTTICMAQPGMLRIESAPTIEGGRADTVGIEPAD